MTGGVDSFLLISSHGPARVDVEAVFERHSNGGLDMRPADKSVEFDGA